MTSTDALTLGSLFSGTPKRGGGFSATYGSGGGKGRERADKIGTHYPFPFSLLKLPIRKFGGKSRNNFSLSGGRSVAGTDAATEIGFGLFSAIHSSLRYVCI